MTLEHCRLKLLLPFIKHIFFCLQNFDILEGDLPDSMTDLTLTGADTIMFGPNSMSRLADARHVRISGPKQLVLRKNTAVNTKVVNLYLDIRGVDVVRMEPSTFHKVQGPLSVTIKNCDFVFLEGEVFSWLLSISVINVRKLVLGKGSFALDPTAANVGQHGPGMSVELVNTTIPELPAQSFGSSAARVYLESVDVHGIRSGAFTANTYNIVMAVNCAFHLIEEEAFAPKSLIHNLNFIGCKIQQLSSKAIQSAVVSLNFSNNSFDNIDSGAINTTVVAVEIINCTFHKFMEKGFEFLSWNKLRLERNSFDELVPNAILTPDVLHVHEFIFNENEIETMHPNSLGFIGQVAANAAKKITYNNNYYGQNCHCNITEWLGRALGAASGELYTTESYCTVDEFFARCFNEPEQNMKISKFINGVCNPNEVQCEALQKVEQTREIKNPRFPHKNKEEPILRERDKKVIGIVIVTILGCVIIAMLITFIKCLRREGYCLNIKNILLSSNSSCGSFCDRLCTCGRGNGLDNARSISQLSVNEYSERHRLNEPRVQEIVQETSLQEVPIQLFDKTTQTLPEELTKELLENLKQRLEVPDNYMEAREMIEHLYEIAKMEELGICPANTPNMNVEENIYELPYQNTMPRVGRNNKKMVSVGTRAPSLDKLMPLSPYNRQTALAHEYFEPLDMAIHLYAEITHIDKEKKNLLGAIPDVIAEQAVPRGPYLRAVREKMNSSNESSPSHRANSSTVGSPLSTSTLKSYNSTSTNSSGKMMNRPLPEKPTNADAGEGTSLRHG
ncbi:uncharacterized protein LOC119190851 isoform X1 [Manduca sexta]|uniref:uncharacterized protein LOC119190851 isoform X1 n=1 Tax=Manduca sexta TaxID=7130 RepID=UPI0018909529|nr:uncharacterized protein LOC119190851 isoform X1 [Manduca sexta]